MLSYDTQVSCPVLFCNVLVWKRGQVFGTATAPDWGKSDQTHTSAEQTTPPWDQFDPSTTASYFNLVYCSLQYVREPRTPLLLAHNQLIGPVATYSVNVTRCPRDYERTNPFNSDDDVW